LSQQAKLQKDYKILEEVLNATNVAQYSRTRNFDKYQWAPRYARGVDHLKSWWNEEDSFELRSISLDEYDKLSDKAADYFDSKKITRRWGGDEVRFFTTLNPVMYEIKIKPHYIKYEEIYNHDAISEYHEIENKIESNGWWPKLHKEMGWPGRGYNNAHEKAQLQARKKHERMVVRRKLKNLEEDV
jgi:hypothetical protein